MKKKRGLSAEDKRRIMLGLFKNPEFYHYKDIEKYSIKNKISFMIVKDILNSLTGDNLVETEKIGSSAYYWSLPTRVIKAKKKDIERLDQQIEEVTNNINNVNKKIDEAKALRMESDERTKKLEQLDEYNELISQKKKFISKFEKKDPERYEKINKDSKTVLDLYEHWSDNIFTIAQWYRTKFCSNDKLDEMFPDLQELHLFD